MLANIQGRLMKIARRILLVLVLVAEFAAAPANATIISAGSYNFNLNFTAAIPYSWANVQVMIASLVTGQHFSITIFPDLNEGGLAIGPATIAGPANLLTLTIGDTSAGLTDGLFSVRLTLDTGTVDISSAVAFVSNSFNGAPIASVPLTLSAVPEPATLALLCLGLAGLGFARRHV